MKGHYWEQGRMVSMSVQTLQSVLSLSNHYLIMTADGFPETNPVSQ